MAVTTAVDPGLASESADIVGRSEGSGPTEGGISPDLFVRSGLAETLGAVVRVARERFSCEGAGIILTSRRSGLAQAAGSAADARRADALQIDHREGPAIDAIHSRQPAKSSELRFDSRWRFWAPHAADLGFRSVLSLVLADDDPFGVLTLYSRRPSFFPVGAPAGELSYAQQASIAIGIAVEREQLLRARDSRGIIGQAQGILMERHDLDADQAFAVLKHNSSHLNLKLRLIAERIITDRTLPADPAALGAASAPTQGRSHSKT